MVTRQIRINEKEGMQESAEGRRRGKTESLVKCRAQVQAQAKLPCPGCNSWIVAPRMNLNNVKTRNREGTTLKARNSTKSPTETF